MRQYIPPKRFWTKVMDEQPVTASRAGLTATKGVGESTRTLEAEVRRLEGELLRCRSALEQIRDRSFEQANSTRLIDQLWHFVRWSKSVAREALEGSRGEDRQSARRK